MAQALSQQHEVSCPLQIANSATPALYALRLAASWAQSHRAALRPPVATAGSHFPTQELHAGKAGHAPRHSESFPGQPCAKAGTHNHEWLLLGKLFPQSL